MIRDAAEYIVFDLETQNRIPEFGRRESLPQLGLSVAVVYESRTDQSIVFREHEVEAFLKVLKEAPLIVGFNIQAFDYQVLRGYTQMNFRALPSVDLMQHVVRAIGFRLSLDNLAQATLNVSKSASGLQAIEWYRQGEWEKLTAYCRDDVLLTRDLYEFGKKHGYVSYFDKKFKRKREIDIAW